MASKLNRILKWLPLVWLTRKTFENLLKFVRNKRIDLITFLLSRLLTWKGAARSKDERSWSKAVRKLASHASLSLWILLRAKFARSYQKARHFLVTASRNSEGLETSNFTQFQSIIARLSLHTSEHSARVLREFWTNQIMWAGAEAKFSLSLRGSFLDYIRAHKGKLVISSVCIILEPWSSFSLWSNKRRKEKVQRQGRRGLLRRN